jgi:hypothetical protein
MLKRTLAWTLRASAFALTYVVNPAYMTACGDSEEEAEQAEQDRKAESQLLAELNGIKQVESWTFVSKQGESYELKLQLTQAMGEDEGEVSRAPRLLNTAHACGNRTFFQSASACATLYELALEGTFSLRKVDDDAPLVADVPVEGRLSNYGELWLAIDGNTADAVMFSKGPGDTYEIAEFTASDLGPTALDIMSQDP